MDTARDDTRLTTTAPPDEQRSSQRRWVMLRVKLEDARSIVDLAHTINVSDSGILIERPANLELEPGQVVSALIEGLLAEEGQAEAHRRMAVVRVDEHVALRFVTEANPDSG